jgi:hypothetical protein
VIPFALNQFKGMLPKLSARLIGDPYAQIAKNCKIDSGRLVPLHDTKEIQAIAQGSTPTTIYDLDGTWLAWDSDVDVEPSLLSDVYEEMVEQYCAGGTTTTLIDTKINFVSAGVEPGMTVKNVTNNTEREITGITTTSQPNDTLVFSATTASASGNLYLVTDEDLVDDRFYYTGDGVPKQSNKTLALPIPALSGPATEYTLGLKKPSTVLSVALGGAPTGTVLKTVSYTYTFVNLFGEESEPSTSTDIVNIEEGHTTTLSNVLIPTGGLEGIEYVRLYRSVTGTTVAQYQLVEQVEASEFATVNDTYEDTVTDDLLGRVLGSQAYKAPVDGLTGLCKFNNMVLAGFYKNTVYMSEPNKPHAWPYAFDLPYQIVSIASFDSQLVVGTTGIPFVITGQDPASVNIEPLPFFQPCYFKRGMTTSPLGVMYICPDGIQQIANSNSHQVITDLILDRDFFPSTVATSLTFFDKKLYIMSEVDSTGYYFEPGDIQAGIFSLDLANDFAFSGWMEKDNNLYMVGELAGVYTVRGWDQLLTTPLTLTWKSKIISNRFSGNYQVAKLFSDEDTSFYYYIDFVLQSFPINPKQVLNGDNFKLPGNTRGREFEIMIETTGNVDYLGMGGSAHDFA